MLHSPLPSDDWTSRVTCTGYRYGYAQVWVAGHNLRLAIPTAWPVFTHCTLYTVVLFTCWFHLFIQKHTYPIEFSVFDLQLLTLDSSSDLIWATQLHSVCFQQVLMLDTRAVIYIQWSTISFLHWIMQWLRWFRLYHNFPFWFSPYDAQHPCSDSHKQLYWILFESPLSHCWAPNRSLL